MVEQWSEESWFGYRIVLGARNFGWREVHTGMFDVNLIRSGSVAIGMFTVAILLAGRCLTGRFIN